MTTTTAALLALYVAGALIAAALILRYLEHPKDTAVERMMVATLSCVLGMLWPLALPALLVLGLARLLPGGRSRGLR